jgi:glycerol-3-phosphate dehydrogenase
LVDGDINNPLCTPEDIAYLLNAVNASTSSNLTTADITGVWAGLRPLLAPRDGKKVSIPGMLAYRFRQALGQTVTTPLEQQVASSLP